MCAAPEGLFSTNKPSVPILAIPTAGTAAGDHNYVIDEEECKFVCADPHDPQALTYRDDGWPSAVPRRRCSLC